MKYVIIQIRIPEGSQVDLSMVPVCPVLFPDFMVHSQMVPGSHKAISAGSFVLTGDGGVVCEGKSDSLHLQSHPIKDAKLIRDWLLYGEGYLVVASIEYLDTVEKP